MKPMRWLSASILIGLVATSTAMAGELLISLDNVQFSHNSLGSYRALVGGVSADGLTLAVTQYDDGGALEGVLWRDAQNPISMTDSSNGLALREALGISGDGHTTVGLTYPGFLIFPEGAIWRDSGQLIPMGFLPSDDGDRYSYANAASFDGRVVVGSSATSNQSGSGEVATIWTQDSGLQPLPIDPNQSAWGSLAWDVSKDGGVVVGSYGGRAFVWDAIQGTTLLGTGVGTDEWARTARVVSQDGTTVAGEGRFDQNASAFVWRASTGLEVIRPDESHGTPYILPLAISAKGDVIVGGFYGGTHGYGEHAFLWTRRQGFRTLRMALEDLGVNTAEWYRLEQAWAISADGTKVIGTGLRQGDVRETFVATLEPVTTGVGLCELNEPGCIPVELVAQTGLSPPLPPQYAASPTRYTQFRDSPKINEKGELAFGAYTDSYPWVVVGPDLYGKPVVRATGWTPAPGVGDGTAVFSYPSIQTNHMLDPILNDAGDLVFMVETTGGGIPSVNEVGLWLSRRGAAEPEIVTQTGTHPPSAPDGIPEVFCPNFQIDRRGRTSLMAADFACIPYSAASKAFVPTKSSEIVPLLAAGDPAPGIDGDVRLVYIRGLWTNSSGSAALWATLEGTDVDASNDTAIWASDSTGALALVMREGDPVPGFATGTTFARLSHGRGENLAYNDHGDVAFFAEFEGPGTTEENSFSFWKWKPDGSLELLLRGGEAPGDAISGLFQEPVMNLRGEMAFMASLQARGGSPYEYWRRSPDGSLARLLGQGDPAPLLPPGTRLGSPYLGDEFGIESLGEPVITETGSVLLDFWLEGVRVDETNDRALYRLGSNGEIVLVLRKGDAIEVAHGVIRTVSGYRIR
ncbi:MAG: hypothetical protein DRR04_14785, partial [Gammaproteobacteria bacterium]